MFGRLFLLFVLVPLIELVLLIEVGQRIGALSTIGLVVATGAIGAALARAQGLKAFMTMQEEVARGEAPQASIVNGVAVLVGGLLLLTPGILTDLLGFALLVPVTRSLITSAISRRIRRGIENGTVGGFTQGGPGSGSSGAGGFTFVSFGDPRARGGTNPAMKQPTDRPKGEGEVGEIRVIEDED